MWSRLKKFKFGSILAVSDSEGNKKEKQRQRQRYRDRQRDRKILQPPAGIQMMIQD
jgi:hypothetical protein